VIVDCGAYVEGLRQAMARDPETVAKAMEDNDDCFAWIGLHEPTAAELARVQELFDLHPLAVEDALKPHQRPKVERYGDSVVVVLRTLWYVDAEDAVETGQVSIFVSRRYVVTVRHGPGGGLSTAREHLEERSSMLGHGPPAVLWAICDSIVDGYEAVAALVEVDVDEIESSVFSADRTSDAERIYTLKREVLEMRRAIIPLKEPMAQFADGTFAGIPPEATPFFRDVSDHLVRVAYSTDGLDALLSSALNAHLARVSVQQNDDMRRISAWVAIAAVPTTIGGVYGMNFENMPELRWHYGFYIVIAIMLTICATMYTAFRRAGWL
jgi:magnesium transporter